MCYSKSIVFVRISAHLNNRFRHLVISILLYIFFLCTSQNILVLSLRKVIRLQSVRFVKSIFFGTSKIIRKTLNLNGFLYHFDACKHRAHPRELITIRNRNFETPKKCSENFFQQCIWTASKRSV